MINMSGYRWIQSGLLGLVFIGGEIMAGELSKTREREAVVLLHGHSRSSSSMKPMARHLTDHGYRVFNIEYPSRRGDMETLVNKFLAHELSMRSLSSFSRVHVVTHSMGGLLIRAYLDQHDLPGLGRVVMLSPPNQGSEIVDRWSSCSVFRWWMGPGGLELGTSSMHLPQQLSSVDYPVGVITGSRSLNWILSMQIPGKDDGKVSINNAKLSGMKDFKVLPVTHPYIMKNKSVMNETVHFLKYGRFEQEEHRAAKPKPKKRTIP